MRYRTYKTTMGQKFRMRVCEDEKHERRLLNALIIGTPILVCWIFAIVAGMV